MMLANNVSSRRKQSKPQRLPSDSINGDESIDPSSSLVDGHVCGDCSGSFYDVSLFVEHKKHCRKSSKQNSLSPEAPIDLSNPRSLDDKSNILFQSFDVLHHQQQKLLELYAQLASRSSATVDESNGDDSSPRSSCLLSPPCSNEEAIRHVCAADRCNESFVSRGALLWHVLNQHPTEKLLQCDNCEERFTDHDQVREHRCEIEQRASSAGEFDRGTSPDADRGSVPALSRRFDFRLLTKSPAITSEEVSSTSPSTQTSMFVSMLKETPLDLTLTANHFMQMPPPIPPSVPRQSFEPLELPYAPLTSTLLGSDDDWEALMEVSQTDELEKIRALVGDKALPTTDPNQCLLCRRVLSCKSALQMHYRTHTGERPFKCKICQRAFTTKGNLKTHMGVHRSKHSFRHGVQQHGVQGVQHQCPICQKRFFSPQLLQQHIQQHTHQLTRNGNGFPSVSAPPPLPPPSSCSTESATPPATMAQSHNYSNLSLLMSPSMVVSSANGPSFPSQAFAAFPALLGFPQLPPHLQPGSYPSTPNLPPFHHNSFGTKPFPGFSTPVSVPSPFTSPMIKLEMTKPEQKMKTDDVVLSNGTAHHHHHHHHHQHRQSNGQLSDHVDDLELATVIRRTSSSSSREPANPLDAMKKMWAETEPPPPRAPPVLSKHQCAVCFKHFSSSSALQIHMRTHTGDKPFKCDICSRAFTTRGNLKVHMGTHMWQQNPSRRGRRIFEFSSSGDQSNGELLSPNGMEKMLPLPPSSMVPPPPPPSAFAFSPLPLGGAAMAAAAAAAVHGNPEMMRWMWHTVCSVCQKICSCPAELEQHLQQHLQQTTVVSS